MKRFFLTLILLLFTFVPLRANSSLNFDGLNDYVQLSNVLNIGSSSHTVEAWVKVPQVGTGNLSSEERVGIVLGNYGSGNANVSFEVYSAGQARYYWNAGEKSFYGTKDLRDGAWHHIAWVRDKSNNKMSIYVDGVLDAEESGAGTDITITVKHRIGNDVRSSGNLYFHGSIDEVRIWNTARTQIEICEYMCENVSSENGLIAYYQMSDDSGTSLTDNSSNTNTGTLTNMDNSDWVNDNQIPSGDGSSTPYQINGLNHLYWASQNSGTWSSDFEQVTDITATAIGSWDSGAGFSFIGTSSLNFSGNYDGNTYSIEGLFINRGSTSYCGMFGQIESGSLISNINLTNMDITGAQSTGGLVGYIESGTVSNCSSSGSVSGSNYVGGITGQIANGTISCCSSTASVSGSGDNVGGLIGLHASAINNSFARGSVSGSDYVGGFAGYAYGGSSIEDCYSTGSVSGSSSVGGLVGYAAEGTEFPFPEEGATITASFWNTETSGQSSSAAGTAKTTALMKTLSTFTDAGWDFEIETTNGTNNYWDMDGSGSENNGYPFLSWQNGTETALPVELSNFIAQEQNGSVLLQWITESETENSGFILEKRIFEEQNWERVADYISNMTLVGQGTSTESKQYQYLDKNVQPGCTYQYRLGDVDYNNTISWHDAVEITMNVEVAQIPKVFGLQMAYPNPFNPTLSIRYTLTEDAHASVRILNLQGQTIAILSDKHQKAGSYELQWQATDIASGIYLVEVVLDEKSDLRKVLLTK
jgi:hypothetical protein